MAVLTPYVRPQYVSYTQPPAGFKGGPTVGGLPVGGVSPTPTYGGGVPTGGAAAPPTIPAPAPEPVEEVLGVKALQIAQRVAEAERQKTMAQRIAAAEPYVAGRPLPTGVAYTPVFQPYKPKGIPGPYDPTQLGPAEQAILGAAFVAPVIAFPPVALGYGVLIAAEIAERGPIEVGKGYVETAVKAPVFTAVTVGGGIAAGVLPRAPRGVVISRAETVGFAGVRQIGEFGPVRQLKGVGGYVSAVGQRVGELRGAGISYFAPRITAVTRKPPLFEPALGAVETRAVSVGPIKSVFWVQRGPIARRLLGPYKRIERVEPGVARGEISPALVELEGVQFRKAISEMQVGKDVTAGIAHIRSQMKKGVTEIRTEEIGIGERRIGRARGTYLGVELPEPKFKAPPPKPVVTRVKAPRPLTDATARGIIQATQKIYGKPKPAPKEVIGAIGVGVEKAAQKALAKEVAKAEVIPRGAMAAITAPGVAPGLVPVQPYPALMVQRPHEPRVDIAMAPKVGVPARPKEVTIVAPMVEQIAPPRQWVTPIPGQILPPRLIIPPALTQPPTMEYKIPEKVKPPPAVTPPFIPTTMIPYRPGRYVPPLRIPGGGLRGMRPPKVRKRAPRRRYQPSLVGVELGVRAPRIPRGPFTGLGIRPVVSARKRGRRLLR